MACLFLVPCEATFPAICITDNDATQAFSNSLIQLWNDFQVTNPGYCPIIRLYNGDYITTPFTLNGLPQPVYGCYHVAYIVGCVGCSSIALFPGIGDLPSRNAINVVIGGTVGYTSPYYTVYNYNPAAPTNQSIPCEVCTTALWVNECSSNNWVEIYNSSYGSTGNTNSDANWDTFVNGLSQNTIYLGNNQYLTQACYVRSFPESYFPNFSNFTFVDIQDWNSEIIPVTGFFSSCFDCSGTGQTGVYKLKDCTNTYLYYVIDNTSASGSLANYVGQTVTLTIPTSLTGLSIPITTCVTVSSVITTAVYTYENLGVITPSLGCSVCTSCYTLTDCNNPNLFYNINTVDSNIETFLDTCASQCNGCEPVIYINYPETEDPACWKLSKCTSVDAVNIDFYDPLVYTLTCSNQGCLACNSICYKVALCPCSGNSVVILANPTFVPFIVLGTPVEGVVTIGPVGDPDFILEGYMTITQLPSCNPIGNTYPIFTESVIEFGNPPIELNNCEEACPPPPGYKLTRCDDSGVYFIASNDLSAVVGKVIRNIKIVNCNSTVGICSSIQEDQCWKVDYYDIPGDFNVVYDSVNVLPNCDCCPGPCD